MAKERRAGLSEIIKKRKDGDRESRQLAARIVISALPGGGTALEIMNAVFGPPLNKRTDVWMEEIVTRLADLEDGLENFSLDSLARNDVFLSVLVQATQAAVRNHKDEKRRYLSNAVVNSALDIDIDHDLQPAFIRFVDELNVLHS